MSIELKEYGQHMATGFQSCESKVQKAAVPPGSFANEWPTAQSPPCVASWSADRRRMGSAWWPRDRSAPRLSAVSAGIKIPGDISGGIWDIPKKNKKCNFKGGT